MNYEKAYKETLERAKKMLIDNNIAFADRFIIATLFPELKESEDERIRNYLTEIIKARTDTDLKFCGFDKKSILAWLEKQKPVNVQPKFSAGDYVKDTNHPKNPIYRITYVDRHCYICEYVGKENMGDKCVMHFTTNNPYLQLTNKPVEWSGEDDSFLQDAVNYFNIDDALQHSTKDMINWLKSLKQRITKE